MPVLQQRLRHVAAAVVACVAVAMVALSLPSLADAAGLRTSPNTKDTIHNKILQSTDEMELMESIDWESLDMSSVADVDIADELHEMYNGDHNGLDIEKMTAKPRGVTRTQLQDATYLFVAAIKNYAHLGEQLLDLGADIDASVEVYGYFDWESCHALHFAVLFNSGDFVEMLLNHQQDLSRKCEGLTAVDIAVDGQRHDLLELLLSIDAPFTNAGFLQAAYHGDVTSMSLLMHHGQKVHEVRGHGGRGDGPLAAAAMEGHLDAVKFLLAIDGIDVNSISMDNGTPLSRALEGANGGVKDKPWGKGHKDIIRLLKDRGALVHKGNEALFHDKKNDIRRMDNLRNGFDENVGIYPYEPELVDDEDDVVNEAYEQARAEARAHTEL